MLFLAFVSNYGNKWHEMSKHIFWEKIRKNVKMSSENFTHSAKCLILNKIVADDILIHTLKRWGYSE